MPSQKNIDTVKDLNNRLEKAKSVIVADYRGLSVNDQQILRRQVVEVGGELMVTKNTLLKIALKNQKMPLDTFVEAFTGPTIILFSYEDEIAPLKALADFAKDHDLPEVKAGFLNKEPLTSDQVKQLSSLPTKVELVAKAIGSIKSPITGVVNVLSGNIKNLIYALEAIKQSKDN